MVTVGLDSISLQVDSQPKSDVSGKDALVVGHFLCLVHDNNVCLTLLKICSSRLNVRIHTFTVNPQLAVTYSQILHFTVTLILMPVTYSSTVANAPIQT